jgi:hypothetical protein
MNFAALWATITFGAFACFLIGYGAGQESTSTEGNAGVGSSVLLGMAMGVIAFIFMLVTINSVNTSF